MKFTEGCKLWKTVKEIYGLPQKITVKSGKTRKFISDIQHNDTQYNNIQHNDTQHNSK